jgi:hypothetical protein
LPTASGEAWVNVARVANLAEAGYLSDELAGLDIEARVFQSDDFSELHGGWKTSYLIRVPTAAAQQAAATIRQHVAEAAAEADAADENFEFSSDGAAIDPNYWRPVAVIVLAGVASFVLGRETAAPERDRLPPGESLAAAVDAIGRPLVTESPPGAPRHRLSYNRPRQMWFLETDLNGDGVIDVRRKFNHSSAAQ